MADIFFLAAGGTGGHLFPAQALAHELAGRGHIVELATDHRVESYGGDFPARSVHIVPSASPRGAGLGSKFQAAAAIARGTLVARRLVARLKPAVIVGFGGYPTVPPMMAGFLARVPTVLHEQNAVMGKANRFLATRATAIATSFHETRGLDASSGKVERTGNPVRSAVIDASQAPYAAPASDGPIELLVFGGSQGARIFSELMPAALALLDEGLRGRIRLVQQARPEDAEAIDARYAELGVDALVATFFTDMPARIAAAHLVICRSGASSVSELSVIGRPAILVPLPHALDGDQKANALTLSAAGGAVVADQADLDAAALAGHIAALAGAPDRLAMMAAAAHATGRPDAVVRLADLVERTAHKQGTSQ